MQMLRYTKLFKNQFWIIATWVGFYVYIVHSFFICTSFWNVAWKHVFLNNYIISLSFFQTEIKHDNPFVSYFFNMVYLGSSMSVMVILFPWILIYVPWIVYNLYFHIYVWFYPYTLLALYTQYLHKLCEQNHRHITRVGFEPTTLAILEQCLINKSFHLLHFWRFC